MDRTAYRSIIAAFPDQFAIGIEAAEAVAIARKRYTQVLVCGMGGSALGAELVNAYLDTRPDILIHRDYGLPNDVTDDTLVLAVSYSGNTEETLSAAHAAVERGLSVVVLTTGGSLGELAGSHSMPIVTLPEGMPPRLSLGVQVGALCTLLETAGVIDANKEALIAAASAMAQDDTLEERGKEIAAAIGSSIPLVYAGQPLAAVARNWKIKLNETSKTQAFWNVVPEANHNEFNALVDGGERFHLITLQDPSDHERVKARFTITERVARQQGLGVSRVLALGQGRLQRLLHTIWLGDWVAYALAVDRGVNPAATPLIDELKKSLAE